MNILMVASEATPFIKTGGLADVAGSLSKELAKTQSVSIILPLYSKVKAKFGKQMAKVASFNVTMSWRKNKATVYSLNQNNVDYYFIDNEQYFNRDNVYGYYDDGERFAFYCLAVAEFIYRKGMKPNIIHTHDWHTGMLACICKETPIYVDYFKNSKFIFTIHNPAFQGLLDPYAIGDLFNLPEEVYTSGKVRFKERISTLKAGIIYSDRITTVSPTHRNELLNPVTSMELDTVLRFREFDFKGILNGIDYVEFNPSKETIIPNQFNAVNYFKQKYLNKEKLFAELNIKNLGKPLFSMVSRVTWQKGMDLAMAAFEEMAKRGCNVIILGSGESKYEEAMQSLRDRYPDRVAVYIGYNDALAHKIYAASDYFLMPSLFEPCGLGQMIAQRYGTLPIVRRTGGLRDSVINFDGSNLETSNGYGFDAFEVDECVRTCAYAYDNWFNLKERKQLMKNAMQTDNSWKKSAEEYLRLYKVVR